MTRRSIRPDPPAGGHRWRLDAACRTNPEKHGIYGGLNEDERASEKCRGARRAGKAGAPDGKACKDCGEAKPSAEY